jgi:transposase
MSKHFRPWKIDQPQMLPADVSEYVPKGHLARFIVALVRESLDLKEFEASYPSVLGQPPFDPRLMVALLLTAYASGIYSSRRIMKACEDRLDFKMIVAQDVPDFRTIADFRKRHFEALAKLFVQVLQLAEKAGLVKLGHVALDGTKIKANASKHKAMSYERMKKRQTELEEEVRRHLAEAEAADAADDAKHGDTRGDELPKWVTDKRQRIAKIQAAQVELEAEAKAMADEERRRRAEADAKREAENRKRTGKEPAPITDEPDPKAQKNFTDPESRIMPSKDGFVQAYNAQAAVDAASQIVVAYDVVQTPSDKEQLVPMTDRIEANLGRKPAQISADNGFCSEANLAAIDERKIDAYIAPGRAKDPTKDNGKPGGPRTQAMRQKIDNGGYETPYRLRKQVVEPVFGQIKQARGFRQFLLRGVENVRLEWALVCTAHNLTKLFRAA